MSDSQGTSSVMMEDWSLAIIYISSYIPTKFDAITADN